MDISIQPDAKGATPQMPLEPPKEIKEMQFSPPPEGLYNSGDGTVITTDKGNILSETAGAPKAEDKVVETTAAPVAKKPDETKPKEEKKDESKAITEKKEPPKKEAEVKSVLKPPTEAGKKDGEVKTDEKTVPPKPSTSAPITPPEKKDDFDYTGFSPQEVTNLKNMSRQSREWVANQMKEKKQLEGLKDSTYLQHEQAYTLSPEYNELSQSVRMAQIEGRHWEQQALRIKAGEKFQDIVGFDQKTGNPVLGPLKDPSDQDELRVVNNYGLCAQEAQRRQMKLQEYPQQFKGRVDQDLQAIKQKQNELFSWVANPTLLEHSVEVEGMGDRKLKDIKNDFMQMIPIYMRSHPIAEVAANMLVGLSIRNAELREARNTGGVQHIQDEEVRRAEPSSDNRDISVKNGSKIPTTMSVSESMLESMGLR